MRRHTRLRPLFPFVFVLGAAMAARAAVGCNTVDVIPIAECKPGAVCTCQEEPNQPLCKGFNERPDGGRVDAASFVDAEAGDLPDATSDGAPDAEPDALDDDGGDSG